VLELEVRVTTTRLARYGTPGTLASNGIMKVRAGTLADLGFRR
jgi:hypothetical protein